jgi:hypothetical protein
VRRYGAGGSVALYVDGPVKPLRIIATLATSDSPSIRIAFVWKINVSPCIPHAKPLPRTIAEVVVLKAPEIRSLVPGPREGVDEDSTVALSPRGATDPLPGTFPEHAAALAIMTAMLMQYRRREDPAMGLPEPKVQRRCRRVETVMVSLSAGSATAVSHASSQIAILGEARPRRGIGLVASLLWVGEQVAVKQLRGIKDF